MPVQERDPLVEALAQARPELLSRRAQLVFT